MSPKVTIVDPIDVPKRDLVEIVRTLQATMYGVLGEHGIVGWDPGQEVEGVELVDAVSRILNQYGLAPGLSPTAWSPRPWGRPQ